MTSYNARYRYNFPNLTYNGELINVGNGLVVTSDTYVHTEVVDTTNFGDLLYELVDSGSFGSIETSSDHLTYAGLYSKLEDKSRYITSSILKSNPIEFGSISFEKNENITATSEIVTSKKSFGVIDKNLIVDNIHGEIDTIIQGEFLANISNQIYFDSDLSNVEFELDIDNSSASNLSITIIPNL